MSDYYNKLQVVLDYIEDNIRAELTLEELSSLSFYSSHHFHRVFQSIVGIPVTDYIRKRKLAVAAKEIIETEKNIVDIALDYGFNSHETFSRAFKRIFDITPQAYRKLKVHAIPADFWKVTFANSHLQKRYMAAVETLCDRLKKDTNVLAVMIMGSLSYDQVWEKSDIDMTIIVNDNCKLKDSLCLMEDEIYINGHVKTRTEFRKLMGSSRQASFTHSYYALGTLVYCKDQALKDLFQEIVENDLGERDRAYALMERTQWVLWRLHKAEKWLKIKSDVRYSYLWITETLKPIAAIEVLLNNNIPTREVILQALKYNNPIIEKLYINLMDERKGSINISQSIELIYEYLRSHRDIICKPILDYFNKTNEMKPLSTIIQDFNNVIDTVTLCEICEWLFEEGILIKDMAETHITSKSNVVVYEPAYFKNDTEAEIYI